MELRKLLLLLAVLYSFVTTGQMQMGLAHDNLNVTEMIRINPALGVDPIQWMDIKAFGAYAIGTNNGAYMAKDSVNIWKNEYPSALSVNENASSVGGQVEAIIYGPALNVSLGKLSVGFNTAFRNYTLGRNLTPEVSEAIIKGPDIPQYYGQPLEGGNYRVKGLSFAELGFNAGYMLYEFGGNIINIGATVKYLFGVGGINTLVDNFSYQMDNDSVANISDFTGSYGGTDLRFNSGNGFGADLGITFEKKINKTTFIPHSPTSKCKYTDYHYRVGFSVLDIGSITFKGSQYREVVNGSGPWDNYTEYNAGSISEIISEMDNLVGNGITVSDTKYKAKLPLSFSLQFDYNYGQGIYINAFLLYGAGLKNQFGAERVSMLAITPRYETKRLGLAAPFSINQFGRAGLGFSIRFWYLSFGTDNFLPLVFNMDIYRLDAYAQIKIPLFASPNCRRKGLGETKWRFKDCSGPGSPRPRGKQKRDYIRHS